MSGTGILVIDDNPTNSKLASFTLEREGYEVRTAGDATEALAVLATFRPAVILMDIQLPGMDGFALTALLRKDPALAGVRVLALTALAMKGDEERALSLGCHGYIAKPVMPDDLRRIVADHVALAAAGASA